METSRPACSEPIASIGGGCRIVLGQAIIPMSKRRFVSGHYKLTEFVNREERVKRTLESLLERTLDSLHESIACIGNRRLCRPMIEAGQELGRSLRATT